MNKNILQKSLALGALMAFVITGQVWAENSGEGSSSSNGGDYGIEAGRGNTVELDNLELYVTETYDSEKDNYFAIRATEAGSITVKSLNAIIEGKEWSAGIEATHEAVVNLGKTTLTVSDGGTEGCEAYGINVARKGIVNVSGNFDATVNGGEWANGIEAYNGSKVSIGNGSVKVALTATTHSDTYSDEEWGIRAHGIFAVGQTKDINGEDGTVEEVAYGGSTININTEQLTIRTTANATGAYGIGIYAEDDSVVKVNGNVDIKSIGNKAYGIKALNASNIELGNSDEKVSIISSCKDVGGESISVYAVGENSKVDIVADELTIKGEWEKANKQYQTRRSLVARNGAVINVTANKAELLGRILAVGRTVETDPIIPSVINIDASLEFNGNNPLDVRDRSQINLVGGEMFGKMNIAGGDVNLTGATFTAENIDANITGVGKLVLTDKGILKTTADQVFTVAGENTEASCEDRLSSNAIKDNVKGKVTFNTGYLSLSDDYSSNYLNSIIKIMNDENKNATKIIMTGNLKNNGGTDNVIDIAQAEDWADKVVLEKVTAMVNQNLLIGGDVTGSNSVSVDGVEATAGVEKGFSVNALDLKNDTDNIKGVIITGGQEVALGGGRNDTSNTAQEVVTVDGEAREVIIVVGTETQVGNLNATKGVLKIGNITAKETEKYQLSGKAVVNRDSELNTKGETTITGGVELKYGNVHAETGHLKANIKAEGTSTIKGQVITDKLEAKDKHTKIHLGAGDYAGKMHAKESILNGGTLFLDPAYAKGIDEGSAFALENASALDGAYIAGQNSVISFGVNDTGIAEKVFERTGLTYGSEKDSNGNIVMDDVNAVIYIDGSTSVANGSITADGNLTTDSISNYTNTLNLGAVKFTDGSLLMVEAEKVNSEFAITNVTNVSIGDDAKLYIDDAEKNKTYKILSGANINSVWTEEDIFTNGNLVTFKVVLAEDGTTYEVNTGLQKVRDVYGDKVIIADVVDNAMASETDATEFFNAAVDSKVNNDEVAQVDALNSIGSMNELAGVTHTTYATSNILTDAVADHMSLANDKEHDKDIWAHYVHTKENVDGLKRAGAYDAQYNGIVVGTDLYEEGKATVGAALTYVDGNINGSTMAARTENDAKYYGASIYGSIENKDTAVIADVSYLYGEHDITQRNSGKLITGEPESDAFSVGVRVEKVTKAGIGKLVPYAGLRYMHLGTGNYTNSIGLAYDADDAELFLLPVGLKYSSEVKNTNGWAMRPVVEVGYVWAFGDTNQTVSLNGASNGFGYDVTDSGSYVGRFMLEAEKANISYALGYEYQKGDNVEADKWMVNVNWKF